MKKNCEVPQCWSTVWLWLGFHENKRRKDLFLLQHSNFYLWSLLFCLLQINLFLLWHCYYYYYFDCPTLLCRHLVSELLLKQLFFTPLSQIIMPRYCSQPGCVMAILSEVSSEENFLSWKMSFTRTNTMHSCLHQN